MDNKVLNYDKNGKRKYKYSDHRHQNEKVIIEFPSSGFIFGTKCKICGVVMINIGHNNELLQREVAFIDGKYCSNIRPMTKKEIKKKFPKYKIIKYEDI